MLKNRIPQLDGLRAVAIFMVFLHHAFHIPLLWMGVDVFFVLSGFLITGILMRRKASGESYFGYFYSRRVRRILPPFLATLLVGSLLFGWAWTRDWPWYVTFSMNIGEAMHRITDPVAPFWSLAVEEQFYLLWPLVILLLPRRWIPRVGAACVIAAPLLRATFTHHVTDYLVIYLVTPFRMDTLAAGALVAFLWHEKRAAFEKLSRYAWPGLLGALAVLGLSSRWHSWMLKSDTVAGNTFTYEFILIAAVSLLLLVLRGSGPIQQVLTLKPVRYVGFISYTIYLTHLAFLRLFSTFTHSHTLVVLSAAVVCLLYSSVSWFLMERPLLMPSKQEDASKSALRLVPAE